MRQMFESAGFQLTDKQMQDFEVFYQLLIQENEKYNLTGITDRTDVYLKHFLDSILIYKLPFEFENKRFIDIGTGAGFPALPLKIMNPSSHITCLDALNKRIGFIKMVCEAVGIQNIELIHGRAEDFGQDVKYRAQYDFAVSRAVAELRLLLEFVMPFVKTNGYFLAYKSLKSKTELEEARNALRCLQSELVDEVKFTLPIENSERDILIIKKTGDLPKKYPRKAGVPKKSPL